MAFPLDSKFNELREVVERVRAELVAFGNAVRSASDSTKAGAAARSAPAAAAGAQAGARQAQAAAPRVRADTSAFVAIDRAAGRASRQVDGLSKALDGASAASRALGFGDLSKRLDQVSDGLNVARTAVAGLAAALPALSSAAILAGGALVALGGFQELIRKTTGHTLSLKDSIQGIGLGLARFAEEGIGGLRVGLELLGEVTNQVVTSLQQKLLLAFSGVLNSVAKTLTDISLAIGNMDPAARAAIPGLETLGDAIGSLGTSLGQVAAGAARKFSEMGAAAVKSAQETKRSLTKQVADIEATKGAYDETVSELFAQPEADRLFEKPRAALGQFATDVAKAMREALRKGLGNLPEPPKETPKGDKLAPAAREIVQSAQEASVEWAGVFSEGLQSGGGGETIDQAIFSALVLDPDKEGRIINSWREFAKNVKTLLKENLFSVVANLFGFGTGLANPPDRGGGAGFARGGLVAGSAVAGARPSWAHMHAQGLARGGRPRGLHPSDIVPIWVGLREYVVNAWAAARPYALQALEAINSGSASPVAMAAVAGTTPVPAPSVGPGFARGGLVGGGSGGSSAPTPAYVVANEESLQRLIAGGSPALFRFFRDNAANIRGELGVGGA